MAYTIDLSGLTTYLNDNKQDLISNVYKLADSYKYFDIQTDVTAPTAIHPLTTDVVLQDGSNCGFNAEGSQTISERVLDPNFIKVNTEWCPKDFYKTFASAQTKVAMGKSELPFEEQFVDDILVNVANKNEKLLWEGDKSSGDLVDGITTIIAKDSAIPTANKFTSSETTVLARLQEMYKKVGDKRVEAFMSAAMYRELITDIVNANYFVYHEDENTDMTLTLPATNFKVHGVDGIDDADTNIYGLVPTDVMIGVDMVNDAEKFDFWWSNDDRVYRMDLEYVLTIQYAFSDNIYVYGI